MANLKEVSSKGSLLRLDHAKQHLGIKTHWNDRVIQRKVRQAQSWCEARANRTFREQVEYIVSFPGWPCQSGIGPTSWGSRRSLGGIVYHPPAWDDKDFVDLYHTPRSPLISVTSVTYWDDANVQQTLDASNYIEHKPDNAEGVIEFTHGMEYPTLFGRADAVEVSYSAGYGSVLPPGQAVAACELMLEVLYDGHEDNVAVQRAEAMLRDVSLSTLGVGW